MMTYIHTLTEEPIESRTMRVAETILDKYDRLAQPSALTKCGLSRDEIMTLTRTMRRECFKPKQYGIAAMTEFLDAGFRDMTKRDWQQWGVSGADAYRWLTANRDRVHRSTYTTSGERCEHLVAYNWKKEN